MNAACATASHGIVGRSPQIREIRQIIPRLARSRSPVLLLGETGVGKEVIARGIHDCNPKGHFVPIDCGSLVGPLMESELFGHIKGAFTGATENKKGLIEHANGGTAFFDEIGDLPLDMQVKLLRVLQEREYRPVGSLLRHKVDIRVIAATHRDLDAEAVKGTFRQDLYYRLNVITLRIPPLRERRDDVVELADFFLGNAERRFSLTHEAKAAMLAYDWPGNIRELYNCVQCMTALNSGPLLQSGDLPENVQDHAQEVRRAERAIATAAVHPSEPPFLAPLAARSSVIPLADVERHAILEALAYTRGDRSMAAQLLRIGRTTLYRKLKEYQLEE